MLFDKWFEICLTILGFLYVADMYFDSVIELIRIGNEIKDECEKQEKEEHLHELTKHLYS